MEMMTLARVAGWALALICVDRVLLWCESRGWIYYRRSKGRRPGLGTSPVLDLLSVYNPSQRPALERRVEAADEQDGEAKDGGRPDDPG